MARGQVETRRVPTGPEEEARFALPGGDNIRTHLHRHWLLHRGDPHTPPSCTTEGGEGGGVSRSVSGIKRCRPRPVSSSCTSGREAPGAGRWEPAQATPRNQTSNLEGSGHCGFFHSSPTLSAAWESIAVISRSDSGIATAGAATQQNLPLENLRLTLRCSERHLVVRRILLVRSFYRAQHVALAAQLVAEHKRSVGPLRVCHHCNPQTTSATAGSRPRLSVARTRTRLRWRQQFRPFVEVTEPGRNSEMSIHNEKMTHPRTPPQHAYCPGTWGSDRDHHPAPGNNRIQIRTGDTLSEARHNTSL